MKIYTRRGDSGETSLFGGKRVSKSEHRISAYGTVDELNSFIGMAASHDLSETGAARLRKIQKLLFILGADLATPSASKTRIDRIGQGDIDFLETSIDKMEKELEPLKNFILPGGSRAGSILHVARTICRRAERAAVACKKSSNISEYAIIFLNRLSDFLFVMARFENMHKNTPEETWKPKRR